LTFGASGTQPTLIGLPSKPGFSVSPDRKYKMKEFQAAYVRETINTHTPLHVDAVDNRFSRGWVVRLDFSTFDEVVEWVQKMTGYGIDWSQCPVSTEPEPEPK
jgi:hypothetical protein